MVRPPDADHEAHRRAWELLPWVVNGRASAAQRREVEAHLAACEDCRREWAQQQALQAAIAAGPAPSGGVEAGLDRLWMRLDLGADEAPKRERERERGRRERPRAAAPVRWLAAALVVESVALAALGVALLLRPAAPPAYLTLGAAPAAGDATIRIVPAQSLRLDDLQRLLHALRLQVVAGPNSVGAYDLAPQADAPPRELQMATLRADAGLRLVEPIDRARGGR
jgi:hypothetical protein